MTLTAAPARAQGPGAEDAPDQAARGPRGGVALGESHERPRHRHGVARWLRRGRGRRGVAARPAVLQGAASHGRCTKAIPNIPCTSSYFISDSP
jgi:hypothetical protein